MKKIKLTQGKWAIVDDEDFDFLNQFKWSAAKGKITYYARGRANGKTQRMHRLLMNAAENQIVDHIDRNGLNNQKSNLRFCTLSQSATNRTAHGVSKYLGVSLEKRKHRNPRWVVMIGHRGSRKRLGRFKNEEDAALAYNEAAKVLYGEFANLNIIG